MDELKDAIDFAFGRIQVAYWFAIDRLEKANTKFEHKLEMDKNRGILRLEIRILP